MAAGFWQGVLGGDGYLWAPAGLGRETGPSVRWPEQRALARAWARQPEYGARAGRPLCRVVATPVTTILPVQPVQIVQWDVSRRALSQMVALSIAVHVLVAPNCLRRDRPGSAGVGIRSGSVPMLTEYQIFARVFDSTMVMGGCKLAACTTRCSARWYLAGCCGPRWHHGLHLDPRWHHGLQRRGGSVRV